MILSHPSRVRGSKQNILGNIAQTEVAPITGAWIETVLLLLIACLSLVAPITGAWIETSYSQNGNAK